MLVLVPGGKFRSSVLASMACCWVIIMVSSVPTVEAPPSDTSASSLPGPRATRRPRIEDNTCRGQPNGSYQKHPLGCAYFFVCISGNVNTGKCPPGLAFNPSKPPCDSASAVGCVENTTTRRPRRTTTTTTTTTTPTTTMIPPTTTMPRTTTRRAPITTTLAPTDAPTTMTGAPSTTSTTTTTTTTSTSPTPTTTSTRVVFPWMVPDDDDDETTTTTTLQPTPRPTLTPTSTTTSSTSRADGFTSSNTTTFTTSRPLGSTTESPTTFTPHPTYYFPPNVPMPPITPQPDNPLAPLEEAIECPEFEDETTVRFLSNNENCSQYYMCYHNSPLRMHCADSLHWNRRTQQCDLRERAQCAGRTAPTNGFPACPQNAVGLHPHPLRCDLFLYCNHGDMQVQQCPFYQHWDVELERCELKTLARCGVGRPPSVSAMVSETGDADAEEVDAHRVPTYDYDNNVF